MTCSGGSWGADGRDDVHLHFFGYLMRIALNVFGALCIGMGGIWILQGINILPGSFMTGQTKWAVYGAVLAVVGIGLLMASRRRV